MEFNSQKHAQFRRVKVEVALNATDIQPILDESSLGNSSLEQNGLRGHYINVSRTIKNEKMEIFREKLTAAIKNHFTKIKNSYVDLYGYSLYTEDGLSSIGPVFNCESEIQASESDEMYNYYRYGAVEWEHFEDYGLFDEVNRELVSIMDCDHPEWSERRNKVLDTCLKVLCSLNDDGLFGPKESNRFVVICLADSDNSIMERSAKLLNSSEVYVSYAEEFL